MQTGMCLGEKLSGEGICSGKYPGVMYGGIVRAGKTPGKMSREKCWDPHAGLQVCTCTGYNLCHPGYTYSLQTTQSYTLTDREADRQLLTGYTISSASGVNKNSEHAMLMTSFTICMTNLML